MNIRLLAVVSVLLMLASMGDGVSGKKCPKKPKGNAVISVLTADVNFSSAFINLEPSATCACNKGKWVKYYFPGTPAPL